MKKSKRMEQDLSPAKYACYVLYKRKTIIFKKTGILQHGVKVHHVIEAFINIPVKVLQKTKRTSPAYMIKH